MAIEAAVVNSDPPPREDSPSSAIVLSGVGGGVDGLGYVLLDQLFTAHITGNTVKTGIDIAFVNLSRAFVDAFPVIVFVAGGFAGALLRTRFWHPRDRRWSENDFESLEHARRLFVDESGWVLRQEQGLDAPLAHELIFESHRIDFTRPSKEQILREIGMTPKSVTEMLEQVDRDQQDE